ncbi:hypothetical protein ElyMa_000814900 [Elysia marginata]|uniref:Secreted protein n=1 Tax=Elysia marginata TaxID=1093978 RepID=A0AAV4GWS9_9GAST|nr:hypothetical protein ElyMa_000814900 [Elysia marginata]
MVPLRLSRLSRKVVGWCLQISLNLPVLTSSKTVLTSFKITTYFLNPSKSSGRVDAASTRNRSMFLTLLDSICKRTVSSARVEAAPRRRRRGADEKKM